MHSKLCNNCGVESLFKKFGNHEDLEVCRNCGGWVYVGDVGIEAKDLYDFSYYNGKEYLFYKQAVTVFKMNFRRKLNVIKRNCNLPLSSWRVLEIGCATGGFLDVCREAGVTNVLGCEVSDYSRNEAQKMGFNVFDPSDKEFATQKIREFEPNVIVAWDVWEHLPNPAAYFKYILGCCLAPPILAISTVASDALVPKLRTVSWRQYHPPSHLNYPTRKSLTIFFKNHSLLVGEQFSFGYFRPLADYISALIGKKNTCKRCLKWTNVIPLYLNMYDIQIIVSRNY